MKRSKKMVLLCHCLLNGNSKVEGLATYPGALKEIICFLMENDIGILQLPCPELTCYGIRRWGHVKEQFDNPYFRKHCRSLFLPFVDQVKDYQAQGYDILGILGIDGSPSCGVDLTCSAPWGGELEGTEDLKARLGNVDMISEEGVFISEIKTLLMENQMNIPLLGIDETDIPGSIQRILSSKLFNI